MKQTTGITALFNAKHFFSITHLIRALPVFAGTAQSEVGSRTARSVWRIYVKKKKMHRKIPGGIFHQKDCQVGFGINFTFLYILFYIVLHSYKGCVLFFVQAEL